MNQNQPYPNQYNDEISLVDLAKTFVKRRRVFYAAFALCFLAGLAFALLQEDRYEYRSLIQLAQDEEGKPLESPESTIASIEYRWLPEYEAEFQVENDRKLPFDFSFSNPESTALIVIRSEAASRDVELVKRAHSSLADQVMRGQVRRAEEQKESLKRQISSLDSTVELLRGETDSGSAIAEAISSKADLQSKLEALVEPDVLVLSRPGIEPVGMPKLLVLVLSAFIGIMGGIFFAFVAEFISVVRDQLDSAV